MDTVTILFAIIVIMIMLIMYLVLIISDLSTRPPATNTVYMPSETLQFDKHDVDPTEPETMSMNDRETTMSVKSHEQRNLTPNRWGTYVNTDSTQDIYSGVTSVRKMPDMSEYTSSTTHDQMVKAIRD